MTKKTHLKVGSPGEPQQARAIETRSRILSVAVQEFAEKGFAGARVDRIADLADANKRMIYQYFGNKNGLYLATLEECYRNIRSLESMINIDGLGPADALAEVVRHTVDYQASHPGFIRLVMAENMNQGQFIRELDSLRVVNSPAIEMLNGILARGVQEGVFEPGVDPVDLHMSISALSFFNVANKHTFSWIFQHDMDSDAFLVNRREYIVREILNSVMRGSSS